MPPREGRRGNTIAYVKGEKKGLEKRKKQWMKKRWTRYSYALGDDIEWEQIEQMENLSVVGWVIGKNFSVQSIDNWVQLVSRRHSARLQN